MFSDYSVLDTFGLYDYFLRESRSVADKSSLNSYKNGFMDPSNVAEMKKCVDLSDSERLRKILNFKTHSDAYANDNDALDRFCALVLGNVFTERQWREFVCPVIEVFDFNRCFKDVAPKLKECMNPIKSMESEDLRRLYGKAVMDEFKESGVFHDFGERGIGDIMFGLSIYNDTYRGVISDLLHIVSPLYNIWPDCIGTVRFELMRYIIVHVY